MPHEKDYHHLSKVSADRIGDQYLYPGHFLEVIMNLMIT